MPTPNLSRRQFAKVAAAVAAASAVYSLIPRRVLGANEKVNVACIGVGGHGGRDVQWVAGTGMANIVALCDVDMDSKRTQGSRAKCPKAKLYQDFRKMFDEMGDQIDAVIISTPPHSHFPAAMLAMSLGKHIYVEKPLAHTFQEVELLMAAERKYGVAAQMGNQGHSGANYFQFKSWTEAGIIKDVTHVDAYMNDSRPWHGWKFTDYQTGETCPKTLDWDLWLGTAQDKPFSKYLHPGNWRGWHDFGAGALGALGAHTLDTIHEFLDLGLPTSIEAVHRDGAKNLIFPVASTIRFQFPERGEMPPMDITWYDGKKNRPPRPKELEKGRKIESCGKIIYSKELVFKGTTNGSTIRIIPEAKMKDMKDEVPRIRGKHSDHMANLLLAAKGQEKTRSNFAVSGPLTQVLLLGVLAQRLGETLQLDRETKQITNHAVANQLLAGPPPRKGWEEFYKLA
ncbi:MAG: Gfo/Idh/MocA family oxidoreductase [Victivallales bacterium]|nr:Gfo/Idh/MocA family oxidoreductase [Victivallales bacterium]